MLQILFTNYPGCNCYVVGLLLNIKSPLFIYLFLGTNGLSEIKIFHRKINNTSHWKINEN